MKEKTKCLRTLTAYLNILFPDFSVFLCILVVSKKLEKYDLNVKVHENLSRT